MLKSRPVIRLEQEIEDFASAGFRVIDQEARGGAGAERANAFKCAAQMACIECNLERITRHDGGEPADDSEEEQGAGPSDCWTGQDGFGW